MSIVAIPKSAPFLDEEIEMLNRVVGSASTTQRRSRSRRRLWPSR